MAHAPEGKEAEARLWLAYVRGLREWAAEELPSLLVSPRAAIKGASMLDVMPAEKLAEAMIFRGIDPESQDRALQARPLPAGLRGL